MLRAAESRKIGLQTCDLGTVDELAVRQDTSYRVIDTFTQATALFGNVDE
jgi:hypothetical protein